MREKERDMELILASGSPRRRELLSLYTTDFTVCVSDFDESTVTADTPAHLVEQLARGKCLAVAKDHPDAVVIGCDTVVDVNGEVFGKPHGVEDAKRMLRALSGAAHQVHTGVCVSHGGRTESFVDSCKVTFFPLSEEEIDFYASTKEPYDKAGAYAIQGRAALWLDRIEGDYYTIMGLPVSRTVQLVERFVGEKWKNVRKRTETLEKTAAWGYNITVLFCEGRRKTAVRRYGIDLLETMKERLYNGFSVEGRWH